MKTLTYYYDIKLNSKYLIYFNKQQQANSQSQSQSQSSTSSSANDSIMMLATNGLDCWSICINDEKFLSNVVKGQLNEKCSFIEFVSHLVGVLSAEQFELNKILNTEHEGVEDAAENSDLLEFKCVIKTASKSKNGDNSLKCRIVMEPVLSARQKAAEIKNVLFFAYQQYNKADLELKKLKSNCGTSQSNEPTNSGASSSNG